MQSTSQSSRVIATDVLCMMLTETRYTRSFAERDTQTQTERNAWLKLSILSVGRFLVCTNFSLGPPRPCWLVVLESEKQLINQEFQG